MARRPLLFPTSDDQQAGLVGGGAVERGTDGRDSGQFRRCQFIVEPAARFGRRSTQCV